MTVCPACALHKYHQLVEFFDLHLTVCNSKKIRHYIWMYLAQMYSGHRTLCILKEFCRLEDSKNVEVEYSRVRYDDEGSCDSHRAAPTLRYIDEAKHS